MNPHPKILPSNYKFLTRNLITSSNTKNVFRKVCVKRFSIKNFIDQRREYNHGAKDLACKLIKDKCFKTLRTISLSSVSQDYLRNNLKACKNIKKIQMTSEIEMDKLTKILKKLSKDAQTIQLKDVTPRTKTDKDFDEFAKTILRFPKLQYFDRDAEASGNKKSFQKELKVYNQLASRLKDVKKVNFRFSPSEIFEFQTVMRKNHVYSGITGLIMKLELDDLFEKVGREVFGVVDDTLYIDIPYDLDDKEDDPTNREVIMKQRMREEMKPFFRFELFPKLKKLDFIQECCSCTLTSFVGDGFQALKNLQELKISLDSRSTNTMCLFKKLSDLPLLQKFSLSLPYMKTEEWALLEQFLKGQENLQTLSICLMTSICARTCHLEQNASLKTIIEFLANKPFLKSLELKSPFWSLEALSKGFSSLNLMNQLHTLIIEASDDIITSDENLVERVKGLSQFIKNQQTSLKTLKISLLFVLHDQIINNIAEAISRLNQLRELEILINYHMELQTDVFVNYFMETLQENMEKKKITVPQKWAPNLAKHLLKLENLQDFTIGFEMLGQSKEEPLDWFMDIMNMLPNLERLREFRIAPKSFCPLMPVEKKMVNAMLQLKNVREIAYEFDHYFELLISFADLKKAIRSLNERQSLRSDLMFETVVKEYAPRFIYL